MISQKNINSIYFLNFEILFKIQYYSTKLRRVVFGNQHIIIFSFCSKLLIFPFFLWFIKKSTNVIHQVCNNLFIWLKIINSQVFWLFKLKNNKCYSSKSFNFNQYQLIFQDIFKISDITF